MDNPQNEALTALCPRCARAGRPVETQTLKALLCPDALARLQVETPYLFCATPSCPLVYFAANASSIYDKDEIEVRVGLKETEAPIPLCYCFGHTQGNVREEIERTGASNVIASITGHIRAGRCGCDVNNPSGTCCLGTITRVVKEMLE